MKLPKFEIKRSGRKTLALEIRPDLTLLVRAPYRADMRTVCHFVERNAEWIAVHTEKVRLRAENHPEPNAAEQARLKELAREYLPGRVKYYSEIMGVEPTRITITGAATRFGSCSGKNGISFSWRLMAYPAEAVDYVVVHELAHIRHHNHSAEFYNFIATVMPDHRERRALLKM